VLAVIPYPGLELLSTAVLMLDEELNVTYANPAAETLLAHGRKHLIGAPIDRALPAGATFVERCRQAVDAQAGFNENDLVLDVDGDPVHLHCVASPFEGAYVAPDAPPALVLEIRELDSPSDERDFAQAQHRPEPSKANTVQVSRGVVSTVAPTRAPTPRLEPWRRNGGFDVAK